VDQLLEREDLDAQYAMNAQPAQFLHPQLLQLLMLPLVLLQQLNHQYNKLQNQLVLHVHVVQALQRDVLDAQFATHVHPAQLLQPLLLL
jgi:hypothetical protein